MQTYNYHFTTTLHDIDAAGVLFFAHLYRHAHDAYEAFMSDIGFSLDELISKNIKIPLVHSEAEYRHPIRHGDKVHVELQIQNIGNSSFTVKYSFTGIQGSQFASASTTHVYLDASGAGSRSLPGALHTELTKYLIVE